MRYGLRNDVFTVFGSQMSSNQDQSGKRKEQKTANSRDEKVNFADMLSKARVRAASGV